MSANLETVVVLAAGEGTRMKSHQKSQQSFRNVAAGLDMQHS
jgi:bifunctional N-acetylglucosamine-1-phosphate-uridyltransferase/glucosamine-1-phosphate-acetyltransferase GlmU-like protein